MKRKRIKKDLARPIVSQTALILAATKNTVDRIESRIERIEERLGLKDPAPEVRS